MTEIQRTNIEVCNQIIAQLIQDKPFKIGDILRAKFDTYHQGEVEIIGRVREFKGEMICCNELCSESPFFCLVHEAVKIDLPEVVVKSLGEVS